MIRRWLSRLPRLVASLPVTVGVVAFASSAFSQTITPRYGAVRDVPSDYFGINQNTVQFPGWADNPTFSPLVDRLNLRSVRYPGGTISQNFDWRTGRHVPGSEPRTDFSYTLDDLEFIRDTAGATPTYVLNMTASGGGLQNQLDLLRTARGRGLAVDRVELGNEFYLGSGRGAFNGGDDYARTANTWAAAIKSEFPGAKIAAVAAQNLPSTDPNTRIGRWNDQMFPILSSENIDAVTLHYYGGSTLGAPDSVTRAPNKWGTSQAQRAQYDALTRPGGPDQFIGAAFDYVENITANTDVPDGFGVWVTENNLFDRAGPARHTWAHGMYTAAVQAQMLRDERVDQTHFHDLINQASLFGLAFTGRGEEFDGLLVSELGITQTLDPEAGQLTASGYAMEMFGLALEDVDRAQRMFFESTPVVTDPTGDTHVGLLGFRMFDDDADSRRILMINFSGDSLEIDTSSFIGQFDDVLTLSADPTRYVIDDDDVRRESFLLDPDGTTTLVPYSMTLFRELTAVPEPSSFVVMGLIVATGAMRRRRR